MIFRIYEKQQFHGGNLFADFLDIFHVPLNEAFSLPERVNPPLARDFLEILRLCNTLPLPHSFVLNTMEPQLYELARCFDDRAVFATPELFSPQERCEILKKYAAFNARIARAYLGRENGKLFFGAGTLARRSLVALRRYSARNADQDIFLFLSQLGTKITG